MERATIYFTNSLDYSVFHLVNGVWANPLFDRLMPFLSVVGNKGAIWLVLLGVIAVFGNKTGRGIALAGLVALAIGFASSESLKYVTMRPRPFLTLPDVRLLVAAPHSYAFPSGHTTSSFAVATGVLLAARKVIRKAPLWGWGLLVLAAAISYSRIYVGVHWPTDVAAGMVLGVVCGWLGARLVTGRAARPPGGFEGPGEGAEKKVEVKYG